MSRVSKILLLFLSLLSVSGFVRAEDKPAKPWKSVTEASWVSAKGNTEATTLGAKENFSYNIKKTLLDLEAGALRATNNGATIAESYFAGEKISYKLSDRNYAYEKYRWDKDRFAGYTSRHDVSLGLGRELMKKAKDLLIAELGAGYVNEQRVNSPVNDFATGRAYAKYTRTISETSNFTQDAEYLQNFENPDDFRSKTETAITAAISTHFSLKMSYVWKHVGSPPAGFKRNDTIATMGLVATY